MSNLYSLIPEDPEKEIIDELLQYKNLRIERIISKGQTSPESGWYDQNENEWVTVLQGAGTIEFPDGSKVKLGKGDYINIPSHKKHKVCRTDPDQVTVWLAIFYN
jgi:cupin 2 domain-containing protein